MTILTLLHVVLSAWREARELERKTLARYPHILR